MTFTQSEAPHITHRSEKAAVEEQKQYFNMRGRMHENPYLNTQLAQIVKIERDDDNKLTGYATVQLVTMNGLRASALMPITSSQYMFFGGLPPTFTLCTVGWLPQGICVILNYYPMIYRKLIEIKGLPELALGEILLRSELEEGGTRRAGATVLLDSSGSVIIKDKDEKTTITMTANGDVTIDADNEITVNADSKVTVNCDEVHLGGESGEELVTKSFLFSVFNLHQHVQDTPVAGTTNVPILLATTQYTSKTKAE